MLRYSRSQHATRHAEDACGCGAGGACESPAGDLCASGLLERPRYFPRQIVTPGDLNLEADYFRARMRRHNRILHGWGVVCGARVCRVDCPDGQGFQRWRVRVSTGYILSPQGDELLVAKDHVVDLRDAGAISGAGNDGRDESGEWIDPWCSEGPLEQESGRRFLAIRYTEVATRPVRPQPAGCGCDDSACEQSRWCDGYEIGLLDCCPPSHTRDKADPLHINNDPVQGLREHMETNGQRGDLEAHFMLDCLRCPSDPWVVLAEIEIDSDGSILRIDNCSCRRIVPSMAMVWGQCQSRVLRCQVVEPDPSRPFFGESVPFVVSGENFTPTLDVD